jgi:hypothetical protein
MSTAVEAIQSNTTAWNSIPGNGSIGGYQWPNQWPAKTTGKLAEALAKAQANFTAVPKSKTGKVKGTTKDGRPYEYEYQYADLSDVLGMAVPKLAKEGIAFSQPIRREGDKMFVVTRIQLGDEFLEDAGMPVPTQVKPQELGGYLTYYRRYGASSFLGIVAEEDTDGPQDENKVKPSTSGQASYQSARREGEAAVQASIAKRGRPAIQKTSDGGESALQEQNKAGSVTKPLGDDLRASSALATPEPSGTLANDSDVPSNISSKPTKEQMDEIKKKLKSFGMEQEALKTFVLKETGRESAREITYHEWQETIAKLAAAPRVK